MRSVSGRISRHHMRLPTRKLILDLPQDQGKHYLGLAHTGIHKKYVMNFFPFFFFFTVVQPAPFEFTYDRLRLIPKAGLREEMFQSRSLYKLCCHLLHIQLQYSTTGTFAVEQGSVRLTICAVVFFS